MIKVTFKKICCIMLSFAMLSQASSFTEAYALDKERVSEISKKLMPYVVGIGAPAIACAVIIPLALSGKNKSCNQTPSSDTPGTPTDEKPEVITQVMIDKFISEGKLPGINIHYVKKNKAISKYGYTIENEKLARRFLLGYCRLNDIEVNNIFRKDRANVFFKYSDNFKENFISGYSLFWAYIKEALVKLDEIESDNLGVDLNSKSGKSISCIKSGNRVTEALNSENVYEFALKTSIIPNEDIMYQIDKVESVGKTGTKYSSLYDDLRRYGNGDWAGNIDNFRKNLDDAVSDGIIPGLALLSFDSKADLWWVEVGVSTLHGYRIIDEDVFKGYLKFILNCDVSAAQYALDLFKNQEQKLFLYDESQSRIMSVLNYCKRKGIKWLEQATNFVRRTFGYDESEKVTPAEKVFVNSEFLEGEIFESFNKDFSRIRENAYSEDVKFDGTINFSEFKNQPVLSDNIKRYISFLKGCGCL